MRNSDSFTAIVTITLILLFMKCTTKAQEVDTESGEEDTESGEGSGISSPTSKDNCIQKKSIAFLLDTSDSIGPIGFQVVKDHAKKIVKGLRLSTCDNVGLITFSHFANSQVFPGSRHVTADVIARIDALAGPTRHMPLELKDSKINLGLLLAEQVLFKKHELETKESPEKLVVVITDGHQSQQSYTSRDISVENLAKKLTGKGVRLHVLVVGNSTSIPKLLEITPDERNIFDGSSVDDLIATLVTQKDECERKIDIGFVLDSSESIGPAKFEAIKKYTKKFLHRLDVSKCDHVGLINFNEFANSEIYFRSSETKRDIFKKLDGLENPLRFSESEVNESRINLALLVADKILFTKQLGLRESSEKFLVVMTDGHLTKPAFTATSNENFVKKLTNKGVRIFALAVGNDISLQELLKVTSEERNIFPEKQLDDLIANVLLKKPRLSKNFGKKSDVVV